MCASRLNHKLLGKIFSCSQWCSEAMGSLGPACYCLLCEDLSFFFFSHKTTGYHFNVMKISSFFFFVKPMSPQIFKILFSLVIWKHILQFRRTRFKVTHYIIHNIVRKRPFLMHCIEIWTSSHFFGWQKKCLSWYMQFSFDIWAVISRTHVNINVYA